MGSLFKQKKKAKELNSKAVDANQLTINSFRFQKVYLILYLRHTHASILISKGVDIVKVAHRLGHVNPKNTLETYAHLIPNQENEVADIFHFALSRSVSKCKNESKKLLSETANKHYYINVYWLGYIMI
ncbi:tyrosine-type recombinase/integrase [Lysinibacillus sp. RS5]|uniref:tyrosine-type recombinase/integrase n=1 Tax=unclassified Lysinibacillus TaxID=2636778 RepID=UPI0035BE235E